MNGRKSKALRRAAARVVADVAARGGVPPSVRRVRRFLEKAAAHNAAQLAGAGKAGERVEERLKARDGERGEIRVSDVLFVAVAVVAIMITIVGVVFRPEAVGGDVREASKAVVSAPPATPLDSLASLPDVADVHLWQRLDDPDSDVPETWRRRVPGGWIYRGPGVLVFVPDAPRDCVERTPEALVEALDKIRGAR